MGLLIQKTAPQEINFSLKGYKFPFDRFRNDSLETSHARYERGD